MKAVVLPRYGLTLAPVPKAAGSAVKEAVLVALGVPVDRVGVHRHPALGQMPLAAARRRHPGHLFAAVVRHPLDRLVSCWAQKICTWRCEAQGFARLGFERGMTFAAFVARVAAAPAANVHFAPQLGLLGGMPQMLLRVETLAADWRRLCAATGLPCHAPKRWNTSARGAWPGYYDPATLAAARSVYRDDLAAFGYDGELRP